MKFVAPAVLLFAMVSLAGCAGASGTPEEVAQDTAALEAIRIADQGAAAGNVAREHVPSALPFAVGRPGSGSEHARSAAPPPPDNGPGGAVEHGNLIRVSGPHDPSDPVETK